MRHVCITAALAGGLFCAAPVAAQTRPAPASAPPLTTAGSALDGLFIGGTAGAGSVQNVGGLFGGEVGYQVSEALDVFGEAVWMQDVVTRRRLGIANTMGAYLQNSQGRPATGTLTAPAFYGGAGVRLMLRTSGNIRPYVVFSVGGAHVTLKPAFTLAGSDITSSIAQYGVTLGSDLTGEVTKPAFSGGAGVRFARARWYVDGGIRETSIRTTDQSTNVLRASASLGLKF